MKKLLAVLVVLAFAAPVVPAMADDTLDLSGAMRVRAFSKTDHDLDSTTDNDEEYFDQRFRVQGTITPSEGVQGVFRLDMAENVWGVDGIDDTSSNQDAGGVDVDRAYLVVSKGPVTILGGLQYLGLGNAVAYDAVHTALAVAIKTPVVITAGWAKVDEDQSAVLSTNKTDETGFEDADHYFINFGYSADKFSINAFYAFGTDGADATGALTSDLTGDQLKLEPTLIGVQGKFALGPININAELDIFGGEATLLGGTTLDLVGTQFFTDINMAVNDMVTVGAHLVYSIGTDDATEQKITYLTDDGSTVFSDYGAMNTLGISPLGAEDVFDADLVGGGNGLADGTGTLGGTIYAKIQPMADLALFAQIGYVTAETDLAAVSGELDSVTLYNVSAKYTLVPNAHVSVHYGVFDIERQDNVSADTASTLGARLQIDF
jgi:hypothetical protein